jgi:enhancing lycopene biosynthesis protein 2
VDADCAAWGAVPVRCDARGIVVDRGLKLVTSPGFSAPDADLSAVAEGVEKTVRATLELR